MGRLRLLILACLLMAITFPAYANDARLGLWSISVSMTIAGTDKELGPFVQTQCFTEADVNNPEKLFSEMGGGCTYSDKRYQGKRFTFTVQCSGAVPMQGKGEISFDETSFEGSLEIQAKTPDMGQVKTKSRVTGERLGDCQSTSPQ